MPTKTIPLTDDLELCYIPWRDVGILWINHTKKGYDVSNATVFSGYELAKEKGFIISALNEDRSLWKLTPLGEAMIKLCN